MKLIVLYSLIFIWLFLGIFNDYGNAGDSMLYNKIDDVPDQKWEELSKKIIFWGHQSVGSNLINGIEKVMKENPKIRLNIIESRVGNGSQNGAFFHSKVGVNKKPETKIADFVDIVDTEMVVKPDVLALKFCYIDVYDKINVKLLFQQYKEAILYIKQKYPDMTIIHFTMPLRTQQITWKTRIKSLLSRDAWELEDNINRNQFNDSLLNFYKGKEPVFDIARLEAISATGKITVFTHNKKDYLAMSEDNTYDGGHLNESASERIAKEFLLQLINI